MASQDTGKPVVAFMILALLLTFAALIALWAMGGGPHQQLSPTHAETRKPGAVGNHR